MFQSYVERQERLRGETVDVFTYHEIPKDLRIQIVGIWTDALGGSGRDTTSYHRYLHLEKQLAKEFGLLSLSEGLTLNPYQSLVTYFLGTTSLEECLITIELVFTTIVKLDQRDYSTSGSEGRLSSFKAIKYLNRRFQQHGIGYEFVSGNEPKLIRMDAHCGPGENTLPGLLNEPGFEEADQALRRTHVYYRSGHYDKCVQECLKAFGETAKTICSKRGWPLPKPETPLTLITTCLDHGLLSHIENEHLGCFQAALASEKPTLREASGKHEQREAFREVPRFYAEYVITETSVSVLLLLKALKKLEGDN